MPKERFYHIGSKNALLELLRDGIEFEKILISASAYKDPKTREILRLASKAKIPIIKTPKRVLQRRSRSASYESIVGLMIPKNTFSLESVLNEIYENDYDPFILILDHLKYSQNIGAIFRTAYAVGVNCVVLPNKEFGYINEEVVRISMGACFRIPVVNLGILNAVSIIKKQGIPLVGIHMQGRRYYKTDLSGPIAFVVGAEDVGISPGVFNKLDRKVSIPMRNGIDSLNVSVSAGIVMFDKYRQSH